MDLKKMENMMADPDDEVVKDVDPDASDDESLEDESFLAKNKKKLIIVGLVVIVIVGVVIFILTRPKPEPPPVVAPPVATPAPDPWLESQKKLYEQGIGSHFIDDAMVFEQGNLETFTFREDFSQVDQPELFELPIKIDIANDSMSYTKHRAVVSSGVEVYWLEGDFRGRKTTTTIPYSLYQVLAPSGNVDVEIEVVTDAKGSLTITHMRALPPTKLKGN